MKTKIMAAAIGVLFAWAGMAHDHPPPVTCEEICRDIQCKCHDICERSGHNTCCDTGTCKGDCNDQKDACLSRCDLQPTMRAR